MTMMGELFRAGVLTKETANDCRYKDQNGWPLTKVVLVRKEDGVALHYPPFDIIVTRY